MEMEKTMETTMVLYLGLIRRGFGLYRFNGESNGKAHGE